MGIDIDTGPALKICVCKCQSCLHPLGGATLFSRPSALPPLPISLLTIQQPTKLTKAPRDVSYSVRKQLQKVDYLPCQ